MRGAGGVGAVAAAAGAVHSDSRLVRSSLARRCTRRALLQVRFELMLRRISAYNRVIIAYSVAVTSTYANAGVTPRSETRFAFYVRVF